MKKKRHPTFIATFSKDSFLFLIFFSSLIFVFKIIVFCF